MIKLHDFGQRGTTTWHPIGLFPIGTMFKTPDTIIDPAAIYIIVGATGMGFDVINASTMVIIHIDAGIVRHWSCEWYCTPTV